MRGLGWVASLAAAAVLVAASPALAAAAVPAPSPSAPAAAPGVSVTPSPKSPYISKSGQFVDIPKAQPGLLIADTAIVFNASDRESTVLVYAVDGRKATGGGFGYSPRGEKLAQAGAWIRLTQSQITVPARTRRQLPFSVRVPDRVEGGTYVAGIAVEVADQATAGPFGTTTRFALPIRLVVPGGAPGATPGNGRPGGRFDITKVTGAPKGRDICPSVTFRNDSQDVIDPVLDVAVAGALGTQRSKRAAAATPVAPGTSRTVRLPCLTRPLGPSTLTVRATTPRGEDVDTFRSTWLPVPLLLALLALLLLILALIATFLRGLRRKRAAPNADSSSPLWPQENHPG